MQESGGIKHLKSDDLAVLPVENDHGLQSVGWVDLDAVSAGLNCYSVR